MREKTKTSQEAMAELRFDLLTRRITPSDAALRTNLHLTTIYHQCDRLSNSCGFKIPWPWYFRRRGGCRKSNLKEYEKSGRQLISVIETLGLSTNVSDIVKDTGLGRPTVCKILYCLPLFGINTTIRRSGRGVPQEVIIKPIDLDKIYVIHRSLKEILS
ncbi:MAG: hypothetical protein KatS3mg104_3043 [Phycisphaerae bacterium]|nr:MAG: hypothetical protein KatS3mg104_3043 [Phycisphaerae bacterium]